MSRVMLWLAEHENKVFFVLNRKWNHVMLDFILTRITHLGGARATISLAILTYVLASQPWKFVGLQCMIALALSHLPVAVIKKKYPRKRPYLVLPASIICKNPLTDHSFPSGHTTAIFSILIPLVLAIPLLGLLLIPLGLIVGLSRIYLGLHYPSDCIAGCFIGTVTAVLTASLF